MQGPPALNPNPDPNPNPNPNPYFNNSYAGNSSYPNPNSDPLKPLIYAGLDTNGTLVQPYPPGTDPQYAPPPVTSTVAYTRQAPGLDTQPPSVAAATAVPQVLSYQDANAAAVQNWVAAIWQLGNNLGVSGVAAPLNSVQNLVFANNGSNSWAARSDQSQRNSHRKKTPKKTKVVQSAWCEVWKIECNSKDVLDQHKLGKKHKKNIEKLSGAISTTIAATALLIGPQEKQQSTQAISGEKTHKRTSHWKDDLETKRKKVLEGGAAVDAVRACVYCNVVCNSETVFNHHLAGQKHTAMVKKYAVVGAM